MAATARRTRKTPYVGSYSNRNLLKSLLSDERLFATIPWWDSFKQQQYEVKEMYRIHAKSSRYTKSKNFSVGGGFYHYCRVPVNIVELMCACDPELDGSNDLKMEQFLRDFPLYDLRVRGD